MLELANVKVPLDAWSPDADTETYLRRAAARKLGVKPASIGQVVLVRRGIDARKKNDVHFVCTLAVGLKDESAQEPLLASGLPGVKEHVAYGELVPLRWPQGAMRPVVVGMGPAGLFAALYLARAGAKPLVLERGACVEERARQVAAFNGGGPLDTSSNVQFGEGGAGTFSDGKLTTNTKNPRIAHVLHWFVEAGAPEQILWEAHPHIGSDRLPSVVRAMRQEIIAHGGEVRFESRFTGVRFEGGALAALSFEDAEGAHEVPAERLVLAMGHSARDTFEMLLNEARLDMVPKPFSVGVRIEHRQQAVNEAQWGKAAKHPALNAAEYKLVEHLKGADARNVYSFCMCPGGTVVCAASEEGGVVVNGMSNFARNGINANAALLVGVTPDDFPDGGPLGGVRLQRQIEQAAFEAVMRHGGKPYQAPSQTVASFLGLPESDGGRHPVAPTYARGTVACDLRECLPGFVCDALREALPLLGRKLKGFDDGEAVMTAPETRSSSPVRILRGDDFQARLQAGIIGAETEASLGIYPCGEGAGYAGGIMSAAVDGLRVAEAVASQVRDAGAQAPAVCREEGIANG